MNGFMLTELAVIIFLLSSGILIVVIASILWAMKLPAWRLFLLGLFVFPCGIYFLIHNPAFTRLTGYPALFLPVDIYSQYAITFFLWHTSGTLLPVGGKSCWVAVKSGRWFLFWQ